MGDKEKKEKQKSRREDKRMTARETRTGEGEAVRGAALTVTAGAVMMRSLVRKGLKKNSP